MRRLLSGPLTAFAATILSAVSVAAQTNIESNAGIQLDFVNPGARSLALGGAFVGLADDATAAFTNPAGLRFISRKEVSVEGRLWSFATPYTSGGRLGGQATMLGIDQTSALTTADSRRSTASLSFLSLVYPIGRWAVAAYGQRLSDFTYGAMSQGPFLQLSSGDGRLFPYKAALEVSIARYGVSGSYKIANNASVGAGVYVYDFSMTSATQRFDFSRLRPQFYAASTFSSSPVTQDTQQGSDTRVGANVGISVTPDPHVEIGAVYRQGAHLQFTTTRTAAGSAAVTSPGTFSIPAVFSAGVSFHPTDPLKIMLDYSLVQYSQITDSFSLFFPPTAGFSALPQDFKVDDGNEVHVGVEYVLLGISRPVAIRAGSWYDPDHSIRFEPANAQTADPYDLAVFRRGKNVVHGTIGAGVVIGQIEINAAGDASSRTKTVSVSAVVRF